MVSFQKWKSYWIRQVCYTSSICIVGHINAVSTRNRQTLSVVHTAKQWQWATFHRLRLCSIAYRKDRDNVRRNCRPLLRVMWRGPKLVHGPLVLIQRPTAGHSYGAPRIPDLILYVQCNDLSLRDSVRKCEVYSITSCYRHYFQWCFDVDWKAITANLETLKVGLK